MEAKTVWVLWNKKDQRAVISRDNFGNALVYNSRENAQAYLGDFTEHNTEDFAKNYEVREATLSIK